MTTSDRAEVFAPGEYIRDELEARGWTQQDLADIIGKPTMSVNMVITGKRAVSPEMAKALGDAFGTGPELWMNLETAYQLWKSKQASPDIARRASLYAYAPVNEMIRRNWIHESSDVAVLESQVLKFFGKASFDEPRAMKAAARKSTDYRTTSVSELTWFARVRQLGSAVQAKRFDPKAFAKNLPSLRTLCGDPENIRHVPKILAEWGVRFVIVELMKQTRTDGGTLWLDEQAPIVAMTLRFDRIDSFWHTLIHELTHVKNGDGDIIDTGIVADSRGSVASGPKSELEIRTDAETIEYLVPQKELDDFIARVKPFFYKEKIVNLANKIKIHPGIVVGQLHFRKCGVHWSHNREMLLQNQIRKIIAASAIVDGWDAYLGPLVTE